MKKRHNMLRFGACLVLTVLFLACDPPTQNGNAASGDGQTATPSAPGPKNGWLKAATNSQVQVDTLLTRRNFYIVLDGSGSMTEARCAGNSTKTVVAKQAIKRFAKLLGEDDNLGFLAFDSRGITERFPLSLGNRDKFEAAVNDTGADSNTPLHGAIALAYSKLKEQAERQLGYGEYHLIVVTDGEYTFGPDPRGIVDQILSESPVVIHTIGFCIGERHSLNQPGRVIYKDASNPKDIEEGLQAVLAEADKF